MAKHQNDIYQIPIARTNTYKSTLRRITDHAAFRATVLVLLLAIIAFVAYLVQPNNKVPTAHTASSQSTTKSSGNSHANSSTHTASTSSNSNTSTTSNTGSTAANNTSTTTGPCSSVLTANQARAVLGGSPTASTTNGVTSQTTDITTTTCAYTVGASTAKIVERKSNSPTGQHENDDQFGSSRPSGVTSVSGYGQAAYWQSSTGLNVLSNNNWYIVSVTNNGATSESGSEQLAKASPI